MDFKTENSLFSDNTFFRTLFDTIPAFALVIDEDGKVQAINNAIKNLVELTDEEAAGKQGGDVFNCVYAHVDPAGCGHSPHCNLCKVRMTAMKAIAGQTIERAKGKLTISVGDGKTQTLNLLISAAPLKYEDRRLSCVIIEDISEIMELRGIIPICSMCKKVRNDSGYWDQVENYIRSRSDAEFSHGYCPACYEKVRKEFLESRSNEPQEC